jgi:hypothetical protein
VYEKNDMDIRKGRTRTGALRKPKGVRREQKMLTIQRAIFQRQSS